MPRRVVPLLPSWLRPDDPSIAAAAAAPLPRYVDGRALLAERPAVVRGFLWRVVGELVDGGGAAMAPAALRRWLDLLEAPDALEAGAAPVELVHALRAGFTTGPEDGGRRYEVTPGGVALIPIAGPLVRRASPWLEYLFGARSYETLLAAATEAHADDQVRAVAYLVNSPGGTTSGLFDTCDGLAAVRASSGKPTVAIVDDCACSAAYALSASAATELVAVRGAVAGSVGVVLAHVNQAGYDAKVGVEWEFVFAGARKIDGNPHEPLSTPARKSLQRHVDRHFDLLVGTIARHRAALSADALRALDAAVLSDEDAVRARLVDRIAPADAVLAALAETVTRGAYRMKTPTTPAASAPEPTLETTLEATPEATPTPSASTPEATPTATTPAEAAPEATPAATTPTEPPADLAAYRQKIAEEASAAERARALGVLGEVEALAALAGASATALVPGLVAKVVAGEHSIEAVRRELIDYKAGQAGPIVRSILPPAGATPATPPAASPPATSSLGEIMARRAALFGHARTARD